jgi:hypothetical protein
MNRVEKVLVEVKRLSRAERRKLLAALRQEVSAQRRAPRAQASRSGRASKQLKKRESLYGSLLAIAGTIHSDFTDISSDKYKHVAAAALDERD